MQVDFTYKLEKIFSKGGDDIGEYRGIHFVNHHSLVELYKKQIKIENHHKYFVDGILLSIILKIKGISHDYMPGPIFFEKNLWKLDQDTLFIVSRKKGAPIYKGMEKYFSCSSNRRRKLIRLLVDIRV